MKAAFGTGDTRVNLPLPRLVCLSSGVPFAARHERFPLRGERMGRGFSS